MAKGIDPVAAWRSMLLAHSRALRAIEGELETAHMIPLSWYDVLLELNAADNGQLRMQELGMRAVLSRTRISRIVTELEQQRLVERIPDPDDGRASLATITAAGRRALRRAAPIYLSGIERHFTSHLTAQERNIIARGLQRVADVHDANHDPRR